MAKGTFQVKTNGEVVERESDGAFIGVVWITSADGMRLLSMVVMEPNLEDFLKAVEG